MKFVASPFDAIDWFFFLQIFQFSVRRHVLICIGGAIFIALYIYYRSWLFQNVSSVWVTHITHAYTITRFKREKLEVSGSATWHLCNVPSLNLSHCQLAALFFLSSVIPKDFWMFVNLVYDWHLFDSFFLLLLRSNGISMQLIGMSAIEFVDGGARQLLHIFLCMLNVHSLFWFCCTQSKERILEVVCNNVDA